MWGAVTDWKEDELAKACGSYWEPGWFAWHLSNVRPLDLDFPLPARLRIYAVDGISDDYSKFTARRRQA